MTRLHMVGALNQALRQEMEKDDSIVILGEDVGVDGGVFRVTDGLAKKFGSERVVDTPLAEAGIVGVSIGLAINKMKPIPEIQFSGFTYQAFHHIKQHMSRYRQRSESTFTLPMVLRAPYGGGIRALEHHSENPEAFFAHMQGLKVVVPSNPYNAKGLLLASIRDPDPVIFLEPKKVYRSFKMEVPDEDYTIELSRANIEQEGSDLTLISWGSMTRLCLETLEMTEASVELIDLQTIWPVDMDTILESAKKTGRVLIVHEAPKNGGYGAEIAARIQEEAILHLESPIVRVTGLDVPIPRFALENYYLPNAKRILNGMKKVLQF